MVIFVSACSEPTKPGSVSDRLWVTSLPTKGKEEFRAFVFRGGPKGKKRGLHFEGTLFEGRHRIFECLSESPFRIRWKQSEGEERLKVTKCKPRRAYSECIKIDGEFGRGAEFQTRKEWRVPRRSSEADVPVMMQRWLQVPADSEDE